jgi:hypothetical protein
MQINQITYTTAGQVIKPAKEPRKVVVKMYADDVFQLNDGSPKRMEDHVAMFESIKRQEVPQELEPQGGGEVQISLMQIPREFDASKDVTKFESVLAFPHFAWACRLLSH